MASQEELIALATKVQISAAEAATYERTPEVHTHERPRTRAAQIQGKLDALLATLDSNASSGTATAESLGAAHQVLYDLGCDLMDVWQEHGDIREHNYFDLVESTRSANYERPNTDNRRKELARVNKALLPPDPRPQTGESPRGTTAGIKLGTDWHDKLASERVATALAGLARLYLSRNEVEAAIMVLNQARLYCEYFNEHEDFPHSKLARLYDGFVQDFSIAARIHPNPRRRAKPGLEAAQRAGLTAGYKVFLDDVFFLAMEFTEGARQAAVDLAKMIGESPAARSRLSGTFSLEQSDFDTFVLLYDNEQVTGVHWAPALDEAGQRIHRATPAPRPFGLADDLITDLPGWGETDIGNADHP